MHAYPFLWLAHFPQFQATRRKAPPIGSSPVSAGSSRLKSISRVTSATRKPATHAPPVAKGLVEALIGGHPRKLFACEDGQGPGAGAKTKKKINLVFFGLGFCVEGGSRPGSDTSVQPWVLLILFLSLFLAPRSGGC